MFVILSKETFSVMPFMKENKLVCFYLLLKGMSFHIIIMLEIFSGNLIYLIVKLRDLHISRIVLNPNFMTKNWFNDERKTFLHACIFLSNILPPCKGAPGASY